MRHPSLILMVKVPKAGRVKTRLGRDIGMTEAAWWFRRQTATLLRRLSDPRWDMILAVSPDREGLLSRAWPNSIDRVPQGKGDLGERMRRVLSRTAGPTVLVGSDIPDIRKHHILKAFNSLGSASSVIGPSRDGGFWLIGLKHPQNQPVGFFRNVRWSRCETLGDALPTLPSPVAMIDTLSDVDTLDDLNAS